MPWQLAIGISVILSAIAAILQRVLLRENKSDPIAYSALFQIICGLIIFTFGSLTGTISFPNNFSELTPNLILMVIVYSLGNVFVFKALKEGEVSTFTIIFALRALVTVLASTLVLGEIFKVNQLLGGGLIILAIILVNLKRASLKLSRADLFALGAAICFGLANTNDRMILSTFELYTYVSLAFIAPGVLLFLIRPRKIIQTSAIIFSPIIKSIALRSLIYSVGAVTYFIALSSATSSSSQVAVVGLTSVILTVVLSAIFLKERDNLPLKATALVLTFIGTLLVS